MQDNALPFETEIIHADDNDQNGRVALSMCIELKRNVSELKDIVHERQNFWRWFAGTTVFLILVFTGFFWDKTLNAAHVMGETHQQILKLERDNVRLNLLVDKLRAD